MTKLQKLAFVVLMLALLFAGNITLWHAGHPTVVWSSCYFFGVCK